MILVLDELEHELDEYFLGGEGCRYCMDYCEDEDMGNNKDYEQLGVVRGYFN